MLHSPITRASARAATMARAHADVSTRHPLVLGIALGAVLSVALTAGTASSAAAAEEAHSDAIAALTTAPDDTAYGEATGAAGLAVPLADISTDAQTALEAAEASVADAASLTAEVASSALKLDVATTTIDTTALEGRIADLAEQHDEAPLEIVLDTVDTTEDTAVVVAATATLRSALTAAQEKKAAAERAAAAQAAANTVDGAKATARDMASSTYGWGGDQFSCLESLWTKESGWNYQAYNPSGATGIPQSLPGDKMATAGSDWRTNATTQIAWGLSYIDRAYGSPCAAWGHSQATDWY